MNWGIFCLCYVSLSLLNAIPEKCLAEPCRQRYPVVQRNLPLTPWYMSCIIEKPLLRYRNESYSLWLEMTSTGTHWDFISLSISIFVGCSLKCSVKKVFCCTISKCTLVLFVVKTVTFDMMFLLRTLCFQIKCAFVEKKNHCQIFNDNRSK